MFAKELVQPPCSGALLLPAGRVGNCWSPPWPHQPAGNHGSRGNCSPMSQNSSYPTVLPSVNPKIWKLPPAKALCVAATMRTSSPEDGPNMWTLFLPCVWIESYRISAKNENRCPPFSLSNSLSTLVTHLLSHKLYSKHVGMPMTNHFGKVK